MSVICRTCFNIITSGSQYFSINNNVNEPDSSAPVIKAKLEACVPELTLELVKDAVMCTDCLDALCAAYNFKKKCLDTEEKIYDYVLQTDSEGEPINIEKVLKWSSKFATSEEPNDVTSKSNKESTSLKQVSSNTESNNFVKLFGIEEAYDKLTSVSAKPPVGHSRPEIVDVDTNNTNNDSGDPCPLVKAPGLKIINVDENSSSYSDSDGSYSSEDTSDSEVIVIGDDDDGNSSNDSFNQKISDKATKSGYAASNCSLETLNKIIENVDSAADANIEIFSRIVKDAHRSTIQNFTKFGDNVTVQSSKPSVDVCKFGNDIIVIPSKVSKPPTGNPSKESPNAKSIVITRIPSKVSNVTGNSTTGNPSTSPIAKNVEITRTSSIVPNPTGNGTSGNLSKSPNGKNVEIPRTSSKVSDPTGNGTTGNPSKTPNAKNIEITRTPSKVPDPTGNGATGNASKAPNVKDVEITRIPSDPTGNGTTGYLSKIPNAKSVEITRIPSKVTDPTGNGAIGHASKTPNVKNVEITRIPSKVPDPTGNGTTGNLSKTPNPKSVEITRIPSKVPNPTGNGTTGNPLRTPTLKNVEITKTPSKVPDLTGNGTTGNLSNTPTAKDVEITKTPSIVPDPTGNLSGTSNAKTVEITRIPSQFSDPTGNGTTGNPPTTPNAKNVEIPKSPVEKHLNRRKTKFIPNIIAGSSSKKNPNLTNAVILTKEDVNSIDFEKDIPVTSVLKSAVADEVTESDSVKPVTIESNTAPRTRRKSRPFKFRNVATLRKFRYNPMNSSKFQHNAEASPSKKLLSFEADGDADSAKATKILNVGTCPEEKFPNTINTGSGSAINDDAFKYMIYLSTAEGYKTTFIKNKNISTESSSKISLNEIDGQPSHSANALKVFKYVKEFSTKECLKTIETGTRPITIDDPFNCFVYSSNTVTSAKENKSTPTEKQNISNTPPLKKPSNKIDEQCLLVDEWERFKDGITSCSSAGSSSMVDTGSGCLANDISKPKECLPTTLPKKKENKTVSTAKDSISSASSSKKPSDKIDGQCLSADALETFKGNVKSCSSDTGNGSLANDIAKPKECLPTTLPKEKENETVSTAKVSISLKKLSDKIDGQCLSADALETFKDNVKSCSSEGFSSTVDTGNGSLANDIAKPKECLPSTLPKENETVSTAKESISSASSLKKPSDKMNGQCLSADALETFKDNVMSCSSEEFLSTVDTGNGSLANDVSKSKESLFTTLPKEKGNETVSTAKESISSASSSKKPSHKIDGQCLSTDALETFKDNVKSCSSEGFSSTVDTGNGSLANDIAKPKECLPSTLPKENENKTVSTPEESISSASSSKKPSDKIDGQCLSADTLETFKDNIKSCSSEGFLSTVDTGNGSLSNDVSKSKQCLFTTLPKEIETVSTAKESISSASFLKKPSDKIDGQCLSADALETFKDNVKSCSSEGSSNMIDTGNGSAAKKKKKKKENITTLVVKETISTTVASLKRKMEEDKMVEQLPHLADGLKTFKNNIETCFSEKSLNTLDTGNESVPNDDVSKPPQYLPKTVPPSKENKNLFISNEDLSNSEDNNGAIVSSTIPTINENTSINPYRFKDNSDETCSSITPSENETFAVINVDGSKLIQDIVEKSFNASDTDSSKLPYKLRPRINENTLKFGAAISRLMDNATERDNLPKHLEDIIGVNPVTINWNPIKSEQVSADEGLSVSHTRSRVDDFGSYDYGDFTVKMETYDPEEPTDSVDIKPLILKQEPPEVVNIIAGMSCNLEDFSEFEQKFLGFTMNELYANQLVALPECSVTVTPLTDEELKRWTREVVTDRKKSKRKPKRKPKKIYQCSQCTFTTYIRKLYLHHTKMNQTKLRVSKIKHRKCRVFRCSQCNYSAKYESSLKFHMQMHIYSCDLCQFSSTCEDSMIEHKKSHGMKNVYKCNECKFHTADEHDYENHVKSHVVHMYKCIKCIYSSIYKKNLKKHYISCHFKSKPPYSCSTCKDTFTDRLELIQHVLTHVTVLTHAKSRWDIYLEHNYAAL